MFFFWHITPCACGVRGAACDGFGLARNTATTFDVFYWLQVTNFDVFFDSVAPRGADHFDILFDYGVPNGANHFDVLFDSAPNGPNHVDVWDFGIHVKNDVPIIAFDWFIRRLLRGRNFGGLCGEPTGGAPSTAIGETSLFATGAKTSTNDEHGPK
jgi:hypothetical protein